MALMKYQYAIEEMRHGETLALAKQKEWEAREKEVESHKVNGTLTGSGSQDPGEQLLGAFHLPKF